MENSTRGPEYIQESKFKILELKRVTSKINNQIDQFISRLCTDEEKINDLVDRSKEKYTY